MRTITITRQIPVATTSGSVLSYRMAVAASGASEMPNEVFLLNRRPSNPAVPDSSPVDDYQGVCSPADIQAYAVDNPSEGQSLFRSATISLTRATEIDADADWSDIKASVQQLKDSLDAGDRLDSIETFTPA